MVPRCSWRLFRSPTHGADSILTLCCRAYHPTLPRAPYLDQARPCRSRGRGCNRNSSANTRPTEKFLTAERYRRSRNEAVTSRHRWHGNRKCHRTTNTERGSAGRKLELPRNWSSGGTEARFLPNGAGGAETDLPQNGTRSAETARTCETAE